MGNYYILINKTEDNGYFAESGKISDQEILDLLYKGESLKNKLVEIELFNNKGKLSDIINNVFGLPIYSEKILKVLKNICLDEIEFFPVKVDKKTNLKYYFVNTLININAIDYENSKYTELAPNTSVLIFKDIEKLVIKDAIVKNRNIFRLTGFETEIIISSKLKQKLEKLRINELKFINLKYYKRCYSKPNWNMY